MAKQCFIYPFSLRMNAICYNLLQANQYDKIYVLANDLINNTSIIEERKKQNKSIYDRLIYTDSLNLAFAQCETILIADSPWNDFREENIKYIINRSIKESKTLILLPRNSKTILDSLNLKESMYKGLINVASNGWDRKWLHGLKNTDMSEPESFVIFVGQLISDHDCCSIIVDMRAFLQKWGYSVSIISCDRNMMIYDNVYDIWGCINEGYSDFENIVLAINCLICEIDKRKKPDIIIIDCREGMLRYSSTILNGFGIIPYFFSQALHWDRLLLCSPIGLGGSEFYKKISKKLSMKYDCDLKNIIFTNKKLNVGGTEEQTKYIWEYFDQQIIESEIEVIGEVSDLNFYNSLSPVSLEKCIKKLIGMQIYE